MPNSTRMSTKRADTLPRVQVIAAVCFAWLVVFAWIAFSTGLIEEMVFGVCTFFAVVALGLPAVLGIMSSQATGEGRPEKLDQSTEDKIETYTGPLSVRQAAVQILIAPAALAFGFTAIAIVDMLVRHTA